MKNLIRKILIESLEDETVNKVFDLIKSGKIKIKNSNTLSDFGLTTNEILKVEKKFFNEFSEIVDNLYDIIFTYKPHKYDYQTVLLTLELKPKRPGILPKDVNPNDLKFYTSWKLNNSGKWNFMDSNSAYLDERLFGNIKLFTGLSTSSFFIKKSREFIDTIRPIDVYGKRY